MKNKVIIFTVFVVAIIFLYLMLQEPTEPKEFVNEKEVLNYSNLLFNYKIIRYPTSVEITPFSGGNINLGVVGDLWNLKFGIIPGNNSYVKRYVGITNLEEKYNKVTLKAYGNISPLVNFSRNNFVLNENETSAIEVNLYTDDKEVGNYTGEIDVIIKVPKYDFVKILT